MNRETAASISQLFILFSSHRPMACMPTHSPPGQKCSFRSGVNTVKQTAHAMCVHAMLLQSCLTSRLFVTQPIIAHQAPLSMRDLQASILECSAMPSPEDLCNPRIEPKSQASPVLAGGFFTTSAPWEALTLQFQREQSDEETTPGHYRQA